MEDRIQNIEQILQEHQEELHAIRQERASERYSPFDSTVPSQWKSSVASTAAPADDDALLHDAPMARYPVDDIQERKNCELHVSMKNISLKVAVGFALPSEPGACIHGCPIPAGYAHVGVD